MTTKEIIFRNLRNKDPNILKVRFLSRHAVLYKIERPAESWTKTDIQGSLYIVERSIEPFFQVIILNKLNNKDFYKDIPYDNEEFAESIRCWDTGTSKFVLFEEQNEEFSFWFPDPSDNDKFMSLARKIALGTVKRTQLSMPTFREQTGLSPNKLDLANHGSNPNIKIQQSDVHSPLVRSQSNTLDYVPNPVYSSHYQSKMTLPYGSLIHTNIPTNSINASSHYNGHNVPPPLHHMGAPYRISFPGNGNRVYSPMPPSPSPVYPSHNLSLAPSDIHDHSHPSRIRQERFDIPSKTNKNYYSDDSDELDSFTIPHNTYYSSDSDREIDDSSYTEEFSDDEEDISLPNKAHFKAMLNYFLNEDVFVDFLYDRMIKKHFT